MEKQSKRFEDWEEVSCNECSHYWDNSCDGACKGSQKPCNSFLATRSVVIPAQLKRLQRAVKWLYCGLALEAIVIVGVIVFG